MSVPTGVNSGFVKASVLLEKEDTIGGDAASARVGFVVGLREGIEGYKNADNLGSSRLMVESATRTDLKQSGTPRRKLGAPQRKVEGKKNAVATVGDGADEETTAVGATLARKPKAPRKNVASGGKKLSSTLVTKEDDEDIIQCETAPVMKPENSRKKSIPVIEDVHISIMDGQDNVLAKPAPVKKPRASCKKSIVTEVPPAKSTILENGIKSIETIGAAPVKKPRAKKAKDNGQTKLPKGKVVKPITVEELGEAARRKKSSTKRKSDDVELLQAGNAAGCNGPPEPLGLDKAITRRRDWTPVEDRNNETVDKRPGWNSADPYFTNVDLTTESPAANNLGAHLSNYGYQKIADIGAAPPNVAVRSLNGQAPTKRRKLELIETPNCPPPEAKVAQKCKSVKKKPQTITEKATAPYLPEKPPAASPLLQYFTQSTRQYGHSIQVPEAQPKQQPVRTPIHKSTIKVSKSKAKKANGSKHAPLLLPPDEAMKAMKDQNLLFGTSSQLVSDDSPMFVRELQEAIKESESESFHVLQDTPIGGSTNAAYLTGSTVLRRQSSRNLWSEAARDSQGSLLEPEVIDLLDTPSSRDSTRHNVASTSLPGWNRVTKPLVEDTSWTAIDGAQPLSLVRPPPSETATEVDRSESVVPETATVTHDALKPLPRCVAETALRLRPKKRSPEKKKKPSNGKEDSTGRMPNYQGFTMDQLSVAISKYGFKPIRGRDSMISLLEKCWESQARLALQSLPPNVNVPGLGPPSDQATTGKAKATSPAKRKGRSTKVKDDSTVAEGPSKIRTSPPKPRGRPKKSTLPHATLISNGPESVANAPTTPPKSKSKRKALTSEIEDPNPPSTPSPSRRRSSHSPAWALPLAGSSKPFTTHTPSLFAKITEAITSLPPSNDPETLTWHEKILLFDPIVLEDLAAWLNTEGLGRVGIDEEVGPEVVKEWCEGRSVCCLWRQGRNGKRGEAAGKE